MGISPPKRIKPGGRVGPPTLRFALELQMIVYILSRVLRWSVGLFLVAVVSYAMMYYGAGDPIKRMFRDMEAGGVDVDQTTVNNLRAKYGLDQSFPVQFTSYITH